MNKLFLSIVLLCAGCCDNCPRLRCKNITSYSYRPNATTPDGYMVDTNGECVDLAKIDRIITATTTCFAGSSEYETPSPKCVKIVIADDWFHPVNNDAIVAAQIFPCDLPGAQGCAGVIQDSQIIIVTPNLSALAHELIHVQTGAPDPLPERFVEVIRCAKTQVLEGNK